MAEDRIYNIYLIDSDMMFRSMVRKYLETKTIYIPDFHYKLFAFESADKFMKALSHYPKPDFIFTDYYFDEISCDIHKGDVMIEQLRLRDYNCPVYFITDAKKNEIKGMNDDGAEGLILKDFGEIDQMMIALKKSFNLSHPRE